MALVLGTDPPSVVRQLAVVGDDGRPSGATVDTPRGLGLVDLTTLAMMLDLGQGVFTGWRLDGDAAEQLVRALNDCRSSGAQYDLFGHSSMVAARNLLRFSGNCAGCGVRVDLTEPDARDQIFVHTVDPCPSAEPPSLSTPTGESYRRVPSLSDAAPDWPAVVCRRCHERMGEGEYRTFLDFRFDQNPHCPQCGNRRSRGIMYGLPAEPWSIPPWVDIGGCCIEDVQWSCDVCHHRFSL